jgi:hypothetical protein
MKYRIFSKMSKGGDVYYFPEYKNIFGFWCRFKNRQKLDVWCVSLEAVYCYIDNYVNSLKVCVYDYPRTLLENK